MENNVNSETKPSQGWKEKNCKGKILHVFTNITIEPLLVFYLLPAALMGIGIQSMYLTKACTVNLNFTEEVCWSGNGTEGDDAQKEVANMTAWKSLVAAIVPAVLILFMGSWSDKRRRRKPFLLLPLCGDFLSTISFIINAYYFNQLRMEVAGATESVLPSLFGGSTALIMAVFSYIADVTSEKSRSFRIGIANSLYSMCVALGTALSGILLDRIGYVGVFSLGASLYIIGIIYCLIRVKEPNPPIPIPKGTSFFKDFFDLTLVKDTFAIGFKKRQGNRRLAIILLMFMSVFTAGPILGENGVTYYFLVKRLHWDDLNMSYYFTYGGIIAFVGNLLGTVLLIKIFKFRDGTIGIICCICKITASFIYAFSATDWLFYLGPVIEMFGSVSLTAMRSIASKVVPADELGKIYSLFGLCEALAPLVFGPLYSKVYEATVDTMSGTFYIMSGIFTGVIAVIFMILSIMQKKEDATKEKVKPELTNGDHPGANINEAFEDDNHVNKKVEVTKL